MNNMSWTAYKEITSKQTKSLYKQVDALIKMANNGEKRSAKYADMLEALKADYPDAQDFIEYYNL